jgi:hypothetical protein
MNRSTLLGLLALAVAAGVVAMSLSRNSKWNTGETGTSETGTVPSTQVSAVPSDPTGRAGSAKPLVQSRLYTPTETLPAGWEDFRSINQMEQLNRVTTAMENHKLAPDVLAFFEAEVFNRNHMDVTRNNMANALVWQEKPNPKLHDLFIKMLEDETEDPVWRDYCIQFLSESLKSTSEPELVKETLARYAKGKDSKSGTAIIHLAYQEGEGRVQIDESFSKQLETQLADPQVDLATKVSILGVIGQRKDVRLLPLVRTYAKDRDASLKRCAIAALGQIGTQEDLPLVQAGLSDSNRGVQLAAKAAEDRLRSRLPKVVE